MFTKMFLITEKISRKTLKEMADTQFGEMVKAVVDLGQKRVVVGGELHADEEALFLEAGAHQEDLWGINLYPDLPSSEWIEFDSMINIRPRQGNRSRQVENPETRTQIVAIVDKWIVNI